MSDTFVRFARCHNCQAEIVLVRLIESGSIMPCNRGLVDAVDGRMIVTRSGRVTTHGRKNLQGREVHWGTCRANRNAARQERKIAM